MDNKIIIAAPSYSPSIGGVIVLHKLCHILNKLGYDASLYPTLKLNGPTNYFILNENYSTKIAEYIDPEKDIVIYPEIEPGNPFECKNIIRYILNHHHLPEYDNNIVTWNESDYWLYFHEHFYDELREPNYLHIIDPKLNTFKDYGLERKIGSCFTYRKKSNEKESLNLIHPPDSIEIQYNTSDEDLINLFNTCKRFYSYDTETYLNVLAAQCGCESVIVPYKDVLKETIVQTQPSFKYGIAYGLGDLEYANSTRHLLINHLQNLEIQQQIDTKSTFEKIFQHFNL
jgi:hypothetical protein